ncbi:MULTISPECIES: hypothetical protein [unclassified Clostridium]|nr:hypothetical protein [Clostridium sp.]MDY4251600.1 hypothetical protein [Clostridium sp.]
MKVNKKITTLSLVAEGTQAAGFNNVYEALNTAFGTPSTYNPWE